MNIDELPSAYVTEVDGELVLVDPTAVAIMQAVGEPRRQSLYEQNEERIAHFVKRMDEKPYDPSAWVIVILDADDPHGKLLADVLMPGHNWQQYRDAGQIPAGRGIAPRRAIEELLKVVHADAAQKMAAAPTEKLVVVVAGHGASVYVQVARDYTSDASR